MVHTQNVPACDSSVKNILSGNMLPPCGQYKGCNGKKEKRQALLSIPFINITHYKKNKIFSVNGLSHSKVSVDYTQYGTLISKVVAVGLKTS